jgi:hypothetical protein
MMLSNQDKKPALCAYVSLMALRMNSILCLQFTYSMKVVEMAACVFK